MAKLSVGESIIELLPPLTPESPNAKFLAKRGAGIHHIAFKTQKIDQTVADMRKNGTTFTTEKPQPGSDGAKVIFLHPIVRSRY